jgi:hypothetical protein
MEVDQTLLYDFPFFFMTGLVVTLALKKKPGQLFRPLMPSANYSAE